MTSLANLLKSEITRLARKEVRALVEPLRKTNAKYRHDIATLKQQLAEQQRAIAALRRSGDKVPTDHTPIPTRFSAKGLRTLRTRLGLSAADFGLIAGVSGQSIYHWEAGKTEPRANQKAALAGLRALGKREALTRLEALATKPTKR
ncbi:DNA-binding transcriptional regulator YiaG [Lysobacter niabensis]|uniref:DNA-binding transcriptional regulator YiaG n=2 Tax=Agrilutibacter niabensis TaxID=380628 RepID=A0ABU1VNU7_9GAMM|nr:DNA-binding transcriptional regulator YiaG [Lysobacter niabensis]